MSEGVDLTGKRAIVTGGASGIGIETAKTLARRGGTVTLAVRNLEAGRRVAAEIIGETANDSIDVRPLELTDLTSVRSFVDAWDEPLDLLINNAGVMAIQKHTLNDAGWEAQFATNFLGHFALALGLHRSLVRANGARVVACLRRDTFSPRSCSMTSTSGSGPTSRCSPTGSPRRPSLLRRGASGRRADDAITVNTLNPGAIATPLQRHVGGRLTTPVQLQKSPAQGAATTVLLATSPQLEGVGGRYFNDNQEAAPVDERPSNITELVNSVAGYVLDRDNADRLWSISTAAIGRGSP